jgi:hypothetical protein
MFEKCLLLFGSESFSSGFLSKNTKTKIDETVTWLIALYGGKTWSLILKEETG